MLEEAIRFGFRDVAGLEPSAAALSHANPEIRPKIRAEMLRPGLFPAQSFDVIALFQTFDHIPDPAAALDEFHRLLRPNGRVLFLQHNIRALSARILRERSPIIDIGHTYLYDPKTLSLTGAPAWVRNRRARKSVESLLLALLGQFVAAGPALEAEPALVT